MTLAILVGHSVGYYCAHRWMHTRKMYWAHRFHHRFNVFVVPVTANAVSLAEYALAMKDDLDTDFCNYLNYAIEQEAKRLIDFYQFLQNQIK